MKQKKSQFFANFIKVGNDEYEIVCDDDCSEFDLVDQFSSSNGRVLSACGRNKVIERGAERRECRIGLRTFSFENSINH